MIGVGGGPFGRGLLSDAPPMSVRRPRLARRSSPLARPGGHPAGLAGMRADWIAFYDTEYHSVVRFVMRNGASLEDARDATEEAFLDSWSADDEAAGPLVASGQPAVVDSRGGAAQATAAARPSPPTTAGQQRRDSRHSVARPGARAS